MSNNPLGSRFDAGHDSPGFLLWRVTNRWQAALRKALSPHGITHVQFVLLACLTWNNDADGLTQTALSEQVGADPMMVSQVLRALESRGLVERRPDPGDGRARRVHVTAEGAAIAREATRAVEDADDAFFGTNASSERPFIEHLRALDRGHGRRPADT